MKILRILLSIILAAILSLGLISCEGKVNSEGDLTENAGSGNEDDAGNEDGGGNNSGEPDDGGSGEGNNGSGSGDEGGSSGDDGNDNGDNGEDSDKPEPGGPKEFVMLFTNDFHSQIEPLGKDETYNADRGGIKRIKALVDSVRNAEPAVLLADAGDFVQGTYYFSLLNGVVESIAMKELGYDVRTIGNHEFDKNIEWSACCGNKL